jgi:hypothetical protein
MKPISRTELQNAPEIVRAEKERAIIREQEVAGQMWAEQVYKRVKEAAELGKTRYECHWPSSFSAVSYTYALFKLREWFPDSTIDTLIYGALKNDPHTAVRIDWSPRDPPTEELIARRLEKETSW